MVYVQYAISAKGRMSTQCCKRATRRLGPLIGYIQFEFITLDYLGDRKDMNYVIIYPMT